MTEGSEPLPQGGVRLLAIWSRQVETGRMAGRLRIIANLRRHFATAWPYGEITLLPEVSLKSPLVGLLCALRFVLALVQGKPLPLQCAIFSPLDWRAVEAAGRDYNVVYLDGVRLLLTAQRLRQRHPQLRIVVDLDDLMSRRGELLLTIGSPISLGYLGPYVPAPLHRALTTGALGRIALRYEAVALRRAERTLLEICDAATLLSAADAQALKAIAPPGVAAKIQTIPPAVVPPTDTRPFQGCERYIFIGTDTLIQNRMTIDYLRALWARARPRLPLVIFGAMTRTYAPAPGVTFAGYVNDLIDVYDGRSALISPAFLGGGIKTKILEAFAYGCPVICTEATLEGVAIGDYPLSFARIEDMEAFVVGREGDAPEFADAISRGLAYVREYHSPERILTAWRDLIEGAKEPGC